MLNQAFRVKSLFAFATGAGRHSDLRKRDPDRPRAFRTPWVPFVPLLSATAYLYLMLGLPGITWVRFGLWLAVGLVIYFA